MAKKEEEEEREKRRWSREAGAPRNPGKEHLHLRRGSVTAATALSSDSC